MKKFIFVVGCGHSGTTLLASIIGSHSDAYLIKKETHWFLNRDDAFDVELSNVLGEADNLELGHIVEKTPRHVLKIEEILDFFPEAKIIAITRDPRDVVYSLNKRNGNFGAAIKRWKNDNSFALDNIDNPSLYVIKYEDLVVDKEKVISSLFGFVGLNYESSALDYHEKGLNWFGVEKPEKTNGRGEKNHVKNRAWQMTQPVSDFRGRYKGNLTNDQLDRIVSSCSDLACRLGYDLSEDITTGSDVRG